jgi:hypothetical protein
MDSQRGRNFLKYRLTEIEASNNYTFDLFSYEYFPVPGLTINVE